MRGDATLTSQPTICHLVPSQGVNVRAACSRHDYTGPTYLVLSMSATISEKGPQASERECPD